MNRIDLSAAINLANSEDVQRLVKESTSPALSDMAQKLSQLHDVICGAVNLMLDELERRGEALPDPEAAPEPTIADRAIEIHVPDNGKVH